MCAKGLGTGLGALLGEDVLEPAPTGISTVPISKIEPRADQPRTAFDDDALSELAESIRVHGLLQPIAVRAIDNGYYQIIAGERRWRASRLAGLEELPVRILEADEQKTAELALIENLQREDLNPLEEARGYRSLIERFGLTQEQVASTLGKSRPVIANALRILSLPEPALALIEQGKLGLSQARAILELPGDEARTALAQKAADEELTVRQINALIAGKKKRPGNSRSAKDRSNEAVDYAAELGTELTRQLGRKVTVTPSKKGGKLELTYYSDDDLESLLTLLGRR